MRPNFLVCGTQKGGTTSLYHYLRQHPQVFMPAEKELNYFNDHYDRGPEWYARFFAGHEGQPAVGEASPLYMWRPEVPARVARAIPGARLIFLLRDPIERAYSHYWYNVSRGIQDARQSFSEAVRSPTGHERYVAKAFYDEQLERFLRHFDDAQLYVGLTERFGADPAAVLRDCFELLGVDPSFSPNVQRTHNATRVPRSPLSTRLLRLWVPVRKAAQRIAPDAVRRATKPVRSRVHRALFARAPRPPLPDADRRYLDAVFAPHNRRLAEMLGVELDEVWR